MRHASDLPGSSETKATVTYYLPAQALRSTVTSYYFVEVSGPGFVTDRIMPEWTNLRLIISGDWEATFADQAPITAPKASVTGTLERALLVRGTEGLVVGIGLMPQGWGRFTAAPADNFTNRMRELSDAFGPATDQLLLDLTAATSHAEQVKILDTFLLSQMTRPTPEAAVAAAHVALQDPAIRSVADWAAALELSPRQLERLSLRYFGLSPKRLLRRQRLLRALAKMRDDPQASWSHNMDDHFADQSHFIREFQYYLGMSPTTFLAKAQPLIAQAWQRRNELLGSPVHILQPPGASKP